MEVTNDNLAQLEKEIEQKEKELNDLKASVKYFKHKSQFKIGMCVFNSELDDIGTITRINYDEDTVDVEFHRPTHDTWNIRSIRPDIHPMWIKNT